MHEAYIRMQESFNEKVREYNLAMEAEKAYEKAKLEVCSCPL
jgi:hypothetical protein